MEPLPCFTVGTFFCASLYEHLALVSSFILLYLLLKYFSFFCLIWHWCNLISLGVFLGSLVTIYQMICLGGGGGSAVFLFQPCPGKLSLILWTITFCIICTAAVIGTPNFLEILSDSLIPNWRHLWCRLTSSLTCLKAHDSLPEVPSFLSRLVSLVSWQINWFSLKLFFYEGLQQLRAAHDSFHLQLPTTDFYLQETERQSIPGIFLILFRAHCLSEEFFRYHLIFQWFSPFIL